MGTRFFQQPAMFGAVVLILGAIASGCATRGFVRTRVNEKAQELSARMDGNERSIQTHSDQIQAHTGQIEELNSVTREHAGKISTLDGGLQQVDQKTQQAMSVGQGAQGTADKAVVQVSSLGVKFENLGEKFENRNNYIVLSEEKIKFKFDSATIDKNYLPTLDQLAQRLKGTPDAILVMEGRTDSAGDESYNIRLGEKRVEAVIRYLVVNQGVPMHKVYWMSFGKDHPLTLNKTREERAENRAVVMRIMGPRFTGTTGGLVSSAAPTP